MTSIAAANGCYLTSDPFHTRADEQSSTNQLAAMARQAGLLTAGTKFWGQEMMQRSWWNSQLLAQSPVCLTKLKAKRPNLALIVRNLSVTDPDPLRHSRRLKTSRHCQLMVADCWETPQIHRRLVSRGWWRKRTTGNVRYLRDQLQATLDYHQRMWRDQARARDVTVCQAQPTGSR